MRCALSKGKPPASWALLAIRHLFVRRRSRLPFSTRRRRVFLLAGHAQIGPRAVVSVAMTKTSHLQDFRFYVVPLPLQAFHRFPRLAELLPSEVGLVATALKFGLFREQPSAHRSGIGNRDLHRYA